jgi:hypothetical protein
MGEPSTSPTTAGPEEEKLDDEPAEAIPRAVHRTAAEEEHASDDPVTSGRGLPTEIDGALRREGQPIRSDALRFMESSFGRQFSGVRIHTDAQAADLARELQARAFTTGQHVFFAPGEYQPDHEQGRHLLAHELTHVVQQSADGGVIGRLREQPDAGPSGGAIAPAIRPAMGIFRQESPPFVNDADLAAERQFGDKGAPKAQNCGRPPHCPPGFCSPYRSEELAKYYRAKNAGWLMAGISIAVDSRVVPLWHEYLAGGSPPKNLTPDFGKDFTASPTTKKTTSFLYGELQSRLASAPPFVPRFSRMSIGIGSLIPAAITALGDPNSPNSMNFNIPKDIPGNLAGGIGLDQKACPAGAQPSPFNDERHADGTVELARASGREVTATPIIAYQVKDTIDLCPGDCGTSLEQFATVPLSQFEATGISGDIPFTVEFPAPPGVPFTISAPEGPEPTGAGP